MTKRHIQIRYAQKLFHKCTSNKIYWRFSCPWTVQKSIFNESFFFSFTKLPSSWKIVANDLDANLIGLHKAFQEGEITREKVEYLYNKRSLSKVNEAAFLKLREDYNSKPDPLNLYLLITNSFNKVLFLIFY